MVLCFRAGIYWQGSMAMLCTTIHTTDITWITLVQAIFKSLCTWQMQRTKLGLFDTVTLPDLLSLLCKIHSAVGNMTYRISLWYLMSTWRTWISTTCSYPCLAFNTSCRCSIRHPTWRICPCILSFKTCNQASCLSDINAKNLSNVLPEFLIL